jgi:non-specific serine/threonine protein kinase/serine/threonine-protein kinase
MTSARWGEVRDLVDRAIALAPAERIAFLRRSGADEELIADAEDLLHFESDASALFSFTHRPLPLVAEEDPPSPVGAVVGSYRIVSELGRGGMGSVYLAERADGSYFQRVALKVLQHGMHTPGLVQRFRDERQMLASLSHPSIARLLDGGVMADNRPYLVLEYVEGQPIDQYCDRHRLDLAARLRLFIEVARAVQAAHQQLILHLDLKPANILVLEGGAPRLLDFGIARFLHESNPARETAVDTVRPLTLRYASPEQIAGGPLTVGSDVYSLATVLYLLLTGALPRPLAGASPQQAADRMIGLAVRPPSEAAPPERRARLHGDLDAILLRALETSPADRYPTMSAFADDVERYLRNQPVSAHAPGRLYRLRKFWMRNRVAVSAGALASVVLMVSAVLVVRSNLAERQARRTADEQRAVAQRRLNDVRGIAHSYIFDLDPQLQEIPGAVKVRAFALQNGLKYLEAMSRESIEDDDSLAGEIGMGYIRIGTVQANDAMPSLNDHAGARDSMNKGLAIEQQLVAKHPNDLKQLSLLARQLTTISTIEVADGDIVAAHDAVKRCWELVQPLIKAGPTAPRFGRMFEIPLSISDALVGNGDLFGLGDPEAALPWLDRMHQLTATYAAASPANAHSAMIAEEREDISRASALEELGRSAEAGVLLRRALAIFPVNSEHSDDQQSLTVAREALAEWMLSQNDVAGADRLVKLLPTEVSSRGTPDRNDEATLADDLCLHARVDLGNGRRSQGLAELRQSVAIFERLHREDAKDFIVTSVMAVDLRRLAEQPQVPIELRRQLYERSIATAQPYADSHPQVLGARFAVGQSELGLSRIAASAADRQDHRQRGIADLNQVVSAHPGFKLAADALAKARAEH